MSSDRKRIARFWWWMHQDMSMRCFFVTHSQWFVRKLLNASMLCASHVASCMHNCNRINCIKVCNVKLVLLFMRWMAIKTFTGSNDDEHLIVMSHEAEARKKMKMLEWHHQAPLHYWTFTNRKRKKRVEKSKMMKTITADHDLSLICILCMHAMCNFSSLCYSRSSGDYGIEIWTLNSSHKSFWFIALRTLCNNDK